MLQQIFFQDTMKFRKNSVVSLGFAQTKLFKQMPSSNKSHFKKFIHSISKKKKKKKKKTYMEEFLKSYF